MTNPTDDSSGRQFPPGSPALTRYPLDDEQAKAAPGTWPWVVATVVSRAGPGRWTLAVEDPRVTGDDDAREIVFRNASEIRPLPAPGVEELREIFFDEHTRRLP